MHGPLRVKRKEVECQVLGEARRPKWREAGALASYGTGLRRKKSESGCDS